MLPLQPVTIGLIALVVLVLLGIVAVIVLIIKKKYSLNWYQKAALEDSEVVGGKKTNTGALRIVRQQISSRKISSQSSSDEEEGQDNSALLKDEKEEDNYKHRHGLFDKLSKHVGFIQPVVSDPRVLSSTMGGEESRHLTIKPILKTQKSDVGQSGVNRRFSAPVVYGKGSTELSHTKLSATRSAPYGTPIAEANEKTFTLPITASDETPSASSMARLARRRTSMQDSIDTTTFDPSLYRAMERAPTIKEESSVDISEPIGILFITVCLTTDTGLLKVTIHKADLTGFPSSQLQLRNPYFTVFVAGSTSPVRQTRYTEDHQSPVIEESFLFEVGDDLSGKRLVCNLYDYDQFVKTEKIGLVQLRLNSIPHDEPLSIQKHIDRCLAESHVHEENYVGELLFSLKCSKAKDGLTLTLFIAKAKDLHIEDEIAVLGLMVKATVLEQGRRYKKKRTVDNVKVTTSPMFNQEIQISLPQPLHLQDISVVVDVCKVRLSSSEVIGRVHIGAEEDKREAKHWRELQQSTSADGKSLEWWHQLKRVDKGS